MSPEADGRNATSEAGRRTLSYGNATPKGRCHDVLAHQARSRNGMSKLGVAIARPTAQARVRARVAPRLLGRLVGVVLLLSFLVVTSEVVVPSSIATTAPLLRWLALALAAIVALASSRRVRPSAAALAWLLSGMYAFGTLVYSFDVPATVLRSVAFTATVVAAFWAGRIVTMSRQVSTHRVMVAGALWCTALAAGGVALQFAGVGDVFYHGTPLFRALYVHPNTLGAVVPMWVPAALWWRDVSPARSWTRRLVGALLAATALALVESKARSGIGATVAGVSAYYLATRNVTKLAGVIAVLVALGGLAAIVAPRILGESRDASEALIYKGSDGDLLASRRGTVETSLANFERSPWFGYGFGTSFGATDGESEWTIRGLSGREKGNAYAGELEEVGGIGTVVMLVPVLLFLSSWRSLMKMKRNARQSGADLALAAAAWAGAFAGLVHNNGEATLWSPGTPFGATLLLLAGIADGLLPDRGGRA